MAKADHIVLCGGASTRSKSREDQTLRLNLSGSDQNVDLEIVDISRRLLTDVPDIFADLVEIASYVYCADQAITRGGEGVQAAGANWRRNFVFHIPVRLPDLWASKEISEALRKTLSILSDDNYLFHFGQRTGERGMQSYLKFGEGEPVNSGIDEVLLFSGGVDSLGGAVQAAILQNRHVALVSHRSNSKIFSRQEKLVRELRARCRGNPPIHVPVWVHQRGSSGREHTQRSRTFLYAALAATVARVFGLSRIRFYENGVVGLNLPISEQAVGARATRTTHPQVLQGFSGLFSLLADTRFEVENPFLWMTKTEVIDLTGDAGFADLIQHSVSCMHTREQTHDQPHCGCCSQCVSRRFAALASRYASSDPEQLYRVDLLTGERLDGVDRTLIESFIRTATDLASMNELQIIERYGEVGRILRHLSPLTSDEVAQRVFELHTKHARDVTRVVDVAIAAHAAEIREGRLPASCGIVLAVPQEYKTTISSGSANRSASGVHDESSPVLNAKLDEHGWYTHDRLADTFKVGQEALRKRLERFRRRTMDGWKENEDRRPREPGYLYQLGAVKAILEELRASGERPAK